MEDTERSKRRRTVGNGKEVEVESIRQKHGQSGGAHDADCDVGPERAPAGVPGQRLRRPIRHSNFTSVGVEMPANIPNHHHHYLTRFRPLALERASQHLLSHGLLPACTLWPLYRAA